MTLMNLIELLDCDVLMIIVLEVYGHKIKIVKYRDAILKDSSVEFLDMIADSIDPILYNGTAALQVNLKD
jgi:hypothetical protein